MAARKPCYFRVRYFDHDSRRVGISGIISDDTEVGKRTVELIDAGRNVNILTTNREQDIERVPSIQSLKSNLPKGYAYDPSLKW